MSTHVHYKCLECDAAADAQSGILAAVIPVLAVRHCDERRHRVVMWEHGRKDETLIEIAPGGRR